MTITTMEELEAVPEGGQVKVRSTSLGEQRWLRVPDGWQRDGVTLPSRVFTGAVNSGYVDSDTPHAIEVGDMWADTAYREIERYCWVAVEVRSPTDLTVASVQRGAFTGLAHWGERQLSRSRTRMLTETERPAWSLIVAEMGARLHVAVNAALAALPEATAGLSEDLAAPAERVPEGLAQALRTVAADLRVESLDQVLVEHGIGRATRHNMVVQLTGTVNNDTIRAMLNTSDVQMVALASWTREVQLGRDGVGCLCGTVTRQDVRGYVPHGSNDDWTFAVSH